MAEVTIIGLDSTLRENALAHLLLDGEPCEAPPWRIRKLFESAELELLTSLEVYSYYSVEIEKSLKQSEDCWSAEFSIELGAPVLIRQVDVQVQGPGAQERVIQQFLDSLPVVQGNTLVHSEYEDFKQGLARSATRRGYFDGAYTTSRIDVYPEELAADVTLIYDTGDRFVFGETTIDQAVVNQGLVDRYINFERGMPYDARLIDELYEALIGAGYFAGVDIRPTPSASSKQEVEIAISLTAAKSRSYTAGVGFGTDTGPKVRGGYINRRRNMKGHQFEINASISPVISEVGAVYRFPLSNPRDERLSFNVGYKNEDTDTLVSEAYKIGAQRIKRRSSRWLETWFIDLGIEDFEVGGDDGRSKMLMPGISWNNSSIPKIPRPLKGHQFSARVSGSVDWLYSDTQFLQLHSFGKFIKPLWDGGRILIRAEIGATAKESFDGLPASLRFFAGGDRSVRGHDYKSLGPANSDGEVIGGSHLLVGSVEIDQKFRGNWSFATFVDAGNAFDSIEDLEVEVSVGAGIRWYSPLGPVRLDVAYPLDSEIEDSYRIHITLGPDL